MPCRGMRFTTALHQSTHFHVLSCEFVCVFYKLHVYEQCVGRISRSTNMCHDTCKVVNRRWMNTDIQGSTRYACEHDFVYSSCLAQIGVELAPLLQCPCPSCCALCVHAAPRLPLLIALWHGRRETIPGCQQHHLQGSQVTMHLLWCTLCGLVTKNYDRRCCDRCADTSGQVPSRGHVSRAFPLH